VASIGDEIASRAPALIEAERHSGWPFRSIEEGTRAMSRYYFDIRDGDVLCPDEEGIEFASRRGAEIEAAMSLAGIAKELPEFDQPHPVGIEVRTDEGPLFQAAFLFQAAKSRH